MNKILVFLFILIGCTASYAEIIEDDVAKTLPTYPIKPIVHTEYNYEDTKKIPVRIRIKQPILSETQVIEGQSVEFELKNNIIYKSKLIAKSGTPVYAKIGLVITSGMNGIPASIIFKDFEIEGISDGQLTNTYEIFGQDRSLLVFPLKWALTILPPTGSLTNFIKGGHAKLKTNKTITLYYHPNWI